MDRAQHAVLVAGVADGPRQVAHGLLGGKDFVEVGEEDLDALFVAELRDDGDVAGGFEKLVEAQGCVVHALFDLAQHPGLEVVAEVADANALTRIGVDPESVLDDKLLAPLHRDGGEKVEKVLLAVPSVLLAEETPKGREPLSSGVLAEQLLDEVDERSEPFGRHGHEHRYDTTEHAFAHGQPPICGRCLD